jgi:hypothetical protein
MPSVRDKNMKRYVILAVILFVPVLAWAEKCWMVGYENDLGYIRIEPSHNKPAMPFTSPDMPKIGSLATLCESAYLRQYLIAGPLGKEDQKTIAGNLLGSSTKVKVLEFLKDREGRQFVAVRVVDSGDNACPKECPRCGGIVY